MTALALALVVLGGSRYGWPDHAPVRAAIGRMQSSGATAVAPRWRLGVHACSIPRGGPTVVTVPGRCSVLGQPAAPGAIVAFTERWSARRFREAHSPGAGTLQHTWVVRVGAHARILRIRSSGDFPPQWVR